MPQAKRTIRLAKGTAELPFEVAVPFAELERVATDYVTPLVECVAAKRGSDVAAAADVIAPV